MLPATTQQSKPLSSYQRGELALVILKCIAGGVLIAGVLVCPNLAQVLVLFKPRNNRDRLKIRRSIHSLKKRGLISVHSESGELRPTKAGELWAAYDSLSIPVLSWDRKWRMVMFDIPESKRGGRIALSRKLLDMGMRHAQDSVFVSPYPCEKEVRVAARYLRVEPFVEIVTALYLSREEKYKKEFGLRS